MKRIDEKCKLEEKIEARIERLEKKEIKEGVDEEKTDNEDEWLIDWYSCKTGKVEKISIPWKLEVGSRNV